MAATGGGPCTGWAPPSRPAATGWVLLTLVGLGLALAFPALGLTAPARAAGVTPVGRAGPCGPPDQDAVTIVIQYGDLGRPTEQYCAAGLTPRTTGAEALAVVGVVVTGSQQAGAAFICRLNGLPGADQAIGLAQDPGYVETCVRNPPAGAYWTYWQAPAGGPWTYATEGYQTRPVQLGGFEGYSFAHNQTTTDAVRPTVTPVRPADARPAATSAPGRPGAPTGPPVGTLLGLGGVVLLVVAGVVVARRRRSR